MMMFVEKTWISLDEGENGSNRVLHIVTDLVLDPEHPAYDADKHARLLDEAKTLVAKHKVDRTKLHGR
jgi:hypothetical protein